MSRVEADPDKPGTVPFAPGCQRCMLLRTALLKHNRLDSGQYAFVLVESISEHMEEDHQVTLVLAGR